MSLLKTDEIMSEIIEQVADKHCLDKRVVEEIINAQYRFAAQAISEYKNVRLRKLGVFYLKKYYKNLIDEGKFVKNKAIDKTREYYKAQKNIQRLEESNLEG